MKTRVFTELLQARWDEGRFLCVGVDPGVLDENPKKNKIPQAAHRHRRRDGKLDTHATIYAFCCAFVDATWRFAAAFKPNSAFFEQFGPEGLRLLADVTSHMRQIAPEVPAIYDGKRGDIGKSNRGYVERAFRFLDADAITLHPYLGQEALRPFLERREKGCIILCKTSNPGAHEFQDLVLEDGLKLWQRVARNVAYNWNNYGNCGLVVGATYPEDMAVVRKEIGDDVFILAPGIGTQGGDLEASVRAGRNSRRQGIIFNSSSGISEASSGPDFAQVAGKKAEELDLQIRQLMAAEVA